MKTSFTYNLLKHLRNKKEEGGFTLIELLVVIIIIGILAAIALPSFLNQANRARESEAANYVGAVNRGQQAYYLEELQFANTVDDMDVTVPKSTDNYFYTNANTGTAGDGKISVSTTTVAGDTAEFYGVPRKTSLKGFAGIVYTNTTTQEQPALICRAEVTGAGNNYDGQVSSGALSCAKGESIGG